MHKTQSGIFQTFNQSVWKTKILDMKIISKIQWINIC